MISYRSLTTIVSMQTAQLDRLERMLQAHLNNTQMACHTGTPRRMEAPSLNIREMRDQVRWAPSPRRSAGGPHPRGHARRSRMEDVD